MWELLLKGKRFCLASGQTSQVKFSTEVKRGTPLFFIEANLALDRCPDLECHTWSWVLCTESLVEIEAEKEGEVELLFSSK